VSRIPATFLCILWGPLLLLRSALPNTSLRLQKICRNLVLNRFTEKMILCSHHVMVNSDQVILIWLIQDEPGLIDFSAIVYCYAKYSLRFLRPVLPMALSVANKRMWNFRQEASGPRAIK
jgi:hypothetical protein